MIAVSLNQLSKKYGRRIGISGVDLTIFEGEVYGLIGPDGAGKSTILRILMNYIMPSDGDAEVFDMDVIDESKQIKRETVYVPSEIYFYNKMKAGKYINFVLKGHRHKKDAFYKEVMTAFEIDLKERFIDMDRTDQKKMALAAAIAAEPKLLLLDEPLRGLDANVQRRLFKYLMDLSDRGTTILITGRDAEEIAPICDKIAIIENGEITVTAEEFAEENPDLVSAIYDPTAVVEDELFDDMEDTAELPDLEEAEEEAPTDAEEMEKTIIIPALPEKDEAEEEEEEASDEPVDPEEKEEEIPEEADENEEDEDEAEDDDEIFAPVEEVEAPAELPKERSYQNITMKSIGFQRKAFEDIGAKVVQEENGKIVLEYSGDLSAMAKLLYDLNMDDVCVNSKELQEVFLPFYEGGEEE